MTEEIDYYETLGASIHSTAKEIKRCYRKKALACHPDKHPDNPNAAALFQKLTKALEFLMDESKRKVYDDSLRAKEERQTKLKRQSSVIQRMRADLEQKEKKAAEERIARAATPPAPLHRRKSSLSNLHQSPEDVDRKKKPSLQGNDLSN